MNIQSFLPVDYNRTRKAEVAGLVKKWEKIGLLEGLSDERQEKSNVAILLENQAKQLVVEANRTGTNSNSEEWAGVALPLVRRVFTEISAKDFVSVQPMNLPTGLVFFLDFKYGTAQGGFQTGSGRTSQADSVFGVTDARRGTPGTGGLYGAGRFSYTSNDVSKSLSRSTTVSAGGNTYTTSSISTTAAWNSALNYDSVVSSSLASAGVTLKKVTVATGSLTGLDVEAIRAFAISGSGITTYYPAFTKLNASNHIEFIIRGTATNAVVTYTKQPTSTTRGDFEAGQASATFDAQLDIPEINLELRSEQTVDYWSAKNNEVWDGTKFVQQSAGSGGYYNSQGEWFQTLGTKLQKVSNEIHRLVLKGGGANFMVCSPTVSTVLESIPGYAANTDGTKMEYAMGVQKIGTINSRYTVYKNPYMTENTILLGYRGSQFLETGAVYAPYIPIMMTPTVLDPENFTPRKGIQTRYAKKMVRPEFYGKIYVGGLETI